MDDLSATDVWSITRPLTRRNNPKETSRFYFDPEHEVLVLPSNTGSQPGHELAHLAIHYTTSYGHLLDHLLTLQYRIVVKYIAECCRGMSLSSIACPLYLSACERVIERHRLIKDWAKLLALRKLLEEPNTNNSDLDGIRLFDECKFQLGLFGSIVKPDGYTRAGLECIVNNNFAIIGGYAINEFIACGAEGYFNTDIDVVHNGLLFMLMSALRIGSDVPLTEIVYRRLINTCVAVAELALWPAIGPYTDSRRIPSWSSVDPGARLFRIVKAVEHFGLLKYMSHYTLYQNAICEKLRWSPPAALIARALRGNHISSARASLLRSRCDVLAGLLSPSSGRRISKMIHLILRKSGVVHVVADFIHARSDTEVFVDLLKNSLRRAFTSLVMWDRDPLKAVFELDWVRIVTSEVGEEFVLQTLEEMLPTLKW